MLDVPVLSEMMIKLPKSSKLATAPDSPDSAARAASTLSTTESRTTVCS